MNTRTPFPSRTLLIALLVLASIYFVWRGPLRVRERSKDFQTFYSATRAWFQGSNPYDRENLKSVLIAAGGPSVKVLPALNPPPTFPLLLPLALPRWQAAQILWGCFQSLFVVITLAILVRAAGWPITGASAWGSWQWRWRWRLSTSRFLRDSWELSSHFLSYWQCCSRPNNVTGWSV